MDTSIKATVGQQKIEVEQRAKSRQNTGFLWEKVNDIVNQLEEHETDRESWGEDQRSTKLNEPTAKEEKELEFKSNSEKLLTIGFSDDSRVIVNPPTDQSRILQSLKQSHTNQNKPSLEDPPEDSPLVQSADSLRVSCPSHTSEENGISKQCPICKREVSPKSDVDNCLLCSLIQTDILPIDTRKSQPFGDKWKILKKNFERKSEKLEKSLNIPQEPDENSLPEILNRKQREKVNCSLHFSTVDFTFKFRRSKNSKLIWIN